MAALEPPAMELLVDAAKKVTLVSLEGDRFEVPLKVAQMSDLVKTVRCARLPENALRAAWLSPPPQLPCAPVGAQMIDPDDMGECCSACGIVLLLRLD